MSNTISADQFSIRYDQTTVTHATQFLLSAGDEEIVLNCSSGLITEGSQSSLPIHTRLALPWSAAERLADMLNQALQSQEARAAEVASAAGPRRRTAALPRMTTANV